MGKKERMKECGGRVGSVAVCGSWESGKREEREKNKKKRRKEEKIK